MSCTTSAAGDDEREVLGDDEDAAVAAAPAVGTQTAPFSATANAPGSTARPSPSSACGSRDVVEARRSPATPRDRGGDPARADAPAASAAHARRRAPRRPATRTSVAATAATASASFATGSSQRTPSAGEVGRRRGSGARRRAQRVEDASRLSALATPAPRVRRHVSRKLSGGRRRQLAPPAPDVPARRRGAARGSAPQREPQRAARRASYSAAVREDERERARIPSRFPSGTSRARRERPPLRRAAASWRSIFTGQTSSHEPQRVEANGQRRVRAGVARRARGSSRSARGRPSRSCTRRCAGRPGRCSCRRRSGCRRARRGRPGRRGGAERPLSTMTMCSSPPAIGPWKCDVYVVIGWPVAERASSRRNTARSLEPRHHLLDAHAGDVERRQRACPCRRSPRSCRRRRRPSRRRRS